MTRLSNEERRAVIENFCNRVSEGVAIDEKWKRQMIDASAPKLPDNPTPEQLDAWIELADLVSDPTFVESLRSNAKEVWGKFDMTAMRRAGDEVAATAKHAIDRSVAPESEEAQQIWNATARRWRQPGAEPSTIHPVAGCETASSVTIREPHDTGNWSQRSTGRRAWPARSRSRSGSQRRCCIISRDLVLATSPNGPNTAFYATLRYS